MNKIWLITIIALMVFGCVDGVENQDVKLSGTLKDGLRQVTLDADSKGQTLNFYRGDYVRFLLKGTGTARLSIPDMDVDTEVPLKDIETPYIKFKVTGTYSYTLADKKGKIVVHEYVRANYTAVTSREAQVVLKERGPLILDVRTPGEYSNGHLTDSVLIPVQELQKRLGELSEYKDRPVFIYCATGNRSTVASKILQDNGFQEIYNLRYGISGWARNGYEIVR